MLPKRLWQEMTAAEFRDADTSQWIAVLPVAAIEQHGPHLPVSTDTTIAEGKIARVLALLPADIPATFLPVQAIGKSNEHLASAGTLTLSWETVTRAWIEIGECVARAGVRKLVVVTSHGGNVPIVDIVCRELRVRHAMLAVQTNWSRFGLPDGVFPEREAAYGIHGGDVETSLMLHLRPDLVAHRHADDFHSTQLSFIQEFTHLRGHGPHAFGWMAQDLNPAGVVGDASAATAEKGAAALDHAAHGFVALLDDVHRFDVARLWAAEAPPPPAG